jgi:hypothetical protein
MIEVQEKGCFIPTRRMFTAALLIPVSNNPQSDTRDAISIAREEWGRCFHPPTSRPGTSRSCRRTPASYHKGSTNPGVADARARTRRYETIIGGRPKRSDHSLRGIDSDPYTGKRSSPPYHVPAVGIRHRGLRSVGIPVRRCADRGQTALLADPATQPDAG